MIVPLSAALCITGRPCRWKPSLPVGEFTCPITFERVRPPRPVVKEEGGITYVVQGDYELAFRTVLRFADGRELPIRGKLFGENSQKIVVEMQPENPPL